MADDNIFDHIKVDKRKAKDIQLGRSKSALKDAYRASQDLPQAVLKVSSYSHGQSRAGAHLDYIGRKGDLHVEDPQGNRLEDPEEFNERMNEWALDFDTRKDSRDTVNIILSAPEKSELGAVENSVRDFAKKTFGNSNDYLFAIHNDTEHPHGHLMVKMRGYDGEKLNPGRKDLRDWRTAFSESLREHGVEVDASTRLERGVGKKSTRQNINHLKDRQVPRVDKEAVKQVIRDTQNRKSQKDKPWAKAAKRKTQQQKNKLNLIADQANEAATKSKNPALSKMAQAIKQHANNIPEPKTRAEEIQDQLEQQQHDIER